MACLLTGTAPGARPAVAASSHQLRSSSSQISRGAPLVAAVPRSSSGSSFSGAAQRGAHLRVEALLGNRKWWEAKSPPNVVHINSVQQMVDTMATAGDRLVIVDFFAPWCAACKGIYPKLMKLMEERPDVLLLAVNFDENKTLVKALGVKVLPFFMFYRGAEGKLEGFGASAKKLHLIQEAIERHTTERCYLPGSEAEPVLPEFPNVAPSGKSRLSGSNGVVPGPLRAGAGAPQAVA
ncbi:hypothetical protein ABPG77_005566 [Micractinium sp. CCAP 211/92]